MLGRLLFSGSRSRLGRKRVILVELRAFRAGVRRNDVHSLRESLELVVSGVLPIYLMRPLR